MAIDEKKLIKDLLKWYSGKRQYCINIGFYELLNDIEDCCDAFEDIIKAQPKLDVPDIKVGKWIPCSERLPEENIEVLIQIWYGTMTVGCLSDNRWISEAWVYQIHEVAAWMPLPEAYKGEEK